jgi:hypothetical protein
MNEVTMVSALDLGDALVTPRGTLENRPMRDTSKPANEGGQDSLSYTPSTAFSANFSF